MLGEIQEKESRMSKEKEARDQLANKIKVRHSGPQRFLYGYGTVRSVIYS